MKDTFVFTKDRPCSFANGLSKLTTPSREDRMIQFARCPPLHGPDGIVRGAPSVRPDAADTKGMLPTWIFQRGGEHLLLHCRESARGVTLVVSGDGEPRSYSFHDFAALVKFEGEMAEFLLETGWSPAQLTIEPRPTPDHVIQSEASRRPGAA